MSVNDYWVAKMQATEAGGEEAPEAEATSTDSEDSEEDEEPEPAPAFVDANFRPVADPDKYEGEVFEYNPKRDPEAAVSPEPDPEFEYKPEAPSGEQPTPAETVEPGSFEETGEVTDGTVLAPDLIDEEEQEKRKKAEEEAVENAAKNAEAALEANAAAVAPEEDPNEGTPAETVKPEDLPAEEDVEPVDDEEFEAEKAAATEKVPTQANNKQEIRDYLTYEHGVDPDDLQDQSKAELLDLVRDLEK